MSSSLAQTDNDNVFFKLNSINTLTDLVRRQRNDGAIGFLFAPFKETRGMRLLSFFLWGSHSKETQIRKSDGMDVPGVDRGEDALKGWEDRKRFKENSHHRTTSP